MLMRFKDAEEKEASSTCKVLEYRTVDKDTGFALAKLLGRYPEFGTVMNLKCKILYYILNGSLKAIIGGQNFNVEEGDCIIIPSNEKYFIEGEARFAMISTPAWDPDQYKGFPE